MPGWEQLHRRVRIACCALLVAALAGPALGQEPAGGDEAAAGGGGLPVSLDRIRHRMATVGTEESRLRLRLTERVNVYARAQAVEVLRGFNVESWNSLMGGRTGAAIAYGSPTHNEMVTAATPEFWRQRSSSLAGLGVSW